MRITLHTDTEWAELIRARHNFKRLSPLQREVLQRAVAGDANKVIAFDLRMNRKTVETHRARAMQKMEVGSFAELVRIMVLAGLTSDPTSSQCGTDPQSDPHDITTHQARFGDDRAAADAGLPLDEPRRDRQWIPRARPVQYLRSRGSGS
jgi:DNA-binding CsgD family transcriptional regulator